MTQLVKGGKWVFGWIIVGPGGEGLIPPAAFAEYGFQSDETVFFIRGSRRSGGFSVARRERLTQSRIPLSQRAFGEGVVGEKGQVKLPLESAVQPGEHLLVVRGSGLALGFVQRGPIYEEASKHPEVETFSI